MLEELKGVDLESLLAKKELSKREREDLLKRLDGVEEKLTVLNNIVCDPKTGECKLLEKGDLDGLLQKQPTKSNIGQFDNKELWGQLQKSKTALEDLKEVHLEKLKSDPDYMKKALGDPEFAGRVVDVLCDEESCRIVFNKQVDKAYKNGKTKGQHGSWLTKNKK